jgi:GT2 family glycosyltransferase
MKKKTGVGIITCNRPEYLDNLLVTLNQCNDSFDELVIINDGEDININNDRASYIKNERNIGVGKSKNKALQYLLEKDCEYIFLIEDDMLILDKDVFNKYIEAHHKSGIHHFNYGPGSPFNRKQNIHFDLHNRHLLDQNSEPNPRLIVDYDTVKISLFEHTVAMFSFFTRECLEQAGLIDEDFFNAWEHVDHTYRIIKEGYHPPFWWFADLYDSHKYIKEAPGAINNSSIANKANTWQENVMRGRELYLQKHGHYPNQPPLFSKSDVISFLKEIKQNG